jgi:hypothetical protein
MRHFVDGNYPNPSPILLGMTGRHSNQLNYQSKIFQITTFVAPSLLKGVQR